MNRAVQLTMKLAGIAGVAIGYWIWWTKQKGGG